MKIKSISDVITNSSTQVYCIKCTDALKELCEKENLNIVMFESLEQIRELLIYGMKYDSGALSGEEKSYEKYHEYSDLLSLIREQSDSSCLVPYGDDFFHETMWLPALINSGKTIEEIVDFILPCFSDIVGYAYYSYSDDCYYTDTARILDNNGYNSCRTS